MSHMSQADSLLDSLVAFTSDEPAVEGDNIIIGADRFWSVPEKLKKIGVQYDHNIETITFTCPRYWDNHDMSMMKVYVNYMRSDGITGMYLCENVRVGKDDSTVMLFDWTISSSVTMVQGALSTLICIKKTDADGNEANHWNSELCTELFVSQGMECQESIFMNYPDIITQLLTRMEATETSQSTFESDTNAELEAWKKQVETDRDNWEDAYEADYDTRMEVVETKVSNEEIYKRINEALDTNETTQTNIATVAKEALASEIAIQEAVTAGLAENVETINAALANNEATIDTALANNEAAITNALAANVETIDAEMEENRTLINDSLADGRIRFRIGDDGELEYSILTEEV